jgi:hypothetical protein
MPWLGVVPSETSRRTTISWARTSGVGEVVGFFEAFISQPEDIEAGFVAIDIQFNFSGKNPNRELFL